METVLFEGGGGLHVVNVEAFIFSEDKKLLKLLTSLASCLSEEVVAKKLEFCSFAICAVS